jgi:hypothetical protein
MFKNPFAMARTVDSLEKTIDTLEKRITEVSGDLDDKSLWLEGKNTEIDVLKKSYESRCLEVERLKEKVEGFLQKNRENSDKVNSMNRSEEEARNYLRSLDLWVAGTYREITGSAWTGGDAKYYLSFRPRLYTNDKVVDVAIVEKVCKNAGIETWEWHEADKVFLSHRVQPWNYVYIANTIREVTAKLQDFLNEMVHAERVKKAISD